MDIGVVWDPASYTGDWSVTASDLFLDQGGLQSAVMLSLFTDRRAPAGFTPPVGSPPGLRGWWGDTYTGRQIGSWLWTLDRSIKNGDAALLLAVQDICTVALQW